MKGELPEHACEAARVTVMAHHALDEQVVGCWRALGMQTVLVEPARCVRQSMRARLFGLPGLKVGLSGAPTSIYHATVPRPSAMHVIEAMVEAADLRTPGRGSIYAQDITDIYSGELPSAGCDASDGAGMSCALTLITAVLTMSGSGEKLARVALQLGAGVPVISLGVGTGIRDRLGLLRITISPEKELVHLMVPEHDAVGLQRLLIEEGNLDRPGGGFVYQTPIRAGRVDHMLRIGRQEHAASIEQIIAAVDDLKGGTAWRKRFFGMESSPGRAERRICRHREICFVCGEGEGEEFVRAAMHAGAGGGTVSRVRSLSLSDPSKVAAVARERGIVCVPEELEAPVLKALARVAETSADRDWRLQLLHASSVFSHMRR